MIWLKDWLENVAQQMTHIFGISYIIRKTIKEKIYIKKYLISDYEKNITNVKDNVVLLGAKAGVYESIWKLFLALIFYLAMLVVTFGIKVPCGLFVPSLTIGAIAGRLLGVGMELLSLYTILNLNYSLIVIYIIFFR